MNMSSNARTPTGTGRRGSTASRPIRVRLIRGRSSGLDFTTAGSSGAKSSTRATSSNIPSGSSGRTSEERPERPKVDIGPKSYKAYRNRERLVIRFYVAEGIVRRRGRYKGDGRYYVYDMAGDGKVAGRTSKEGYADKKEAVRVAREYRDKYGAYTRFLF
jgi:hypothetical protein